MERTPQIPPSALQEIYRHARETFPEECCGYILGSGPDAKVVRCVNRQNELHTQNPKTYPRTAKTAYQIGGAELLALARSLETKPRATVIYHSHPRGGAYFSAEDARAATAAGYDVFYLVVDAGAGAVRDCRLFGGVAGSAPPDYREVARFDPDPI